MDKILLVILSLSLGACASLQGGTNRKLTIERMWVKELPYDDRLGPERFHGMTPLILDENIYQGNGKDAFVSIDRKTGRDSWKKLIEYGVGGGAIEVAGNVYFGASDGQFYSLNAKTGDINWTFPLRAECLAEPLYSDGTIYFLTANNVVYALEAETGKQKWLYNRTDTTTFSIRGGAKPTLYQGHIIIGFSDGFLVSLNSKNGSLSWERSLSKNPKFRDINATAVLDGDSIYVSAFDDSLYRLSAQDGQIQWRIEKGSHAPVTISGEVVYYSTSEGELLALNKRDGKTLWTKNIPSGVATQPVVMNELLVYGESRGNLVLLNAADGQQIGKYAAGNGLFATPAIDREKSEIYFVSNAGNLYALRIAWVPRTQYLPWEN